MNNSVRSLVFSVVLSVVLTSTLGFALLYAVAAIPVEPVREHALKAAENGAFANNYPPFLFFRSLDMYTECGGVSMALSARASVESVLAMRGFQECQGLTKSLREGQPLPDRDYARYWQGHQIVLKPLYAFFSVPVVRSICTGVGLGLLVLLYVVCAARLGRAEAGLILLSFALAGSLTVFPLATHAVQFWVAVTAGLAACLYSRSHPPFLLFASVGAVSAFVSFFNLESLSLGLALLCHMCVRLREGAATRPLLQEAIMLCVAWGAAFLAMWLVKWGLALLVLPRGTALLTGQQDIYPPSSLALVGQAMLSNIMRMPWTVALGALFVVGWWRQRAGREYMPASWVLALPAAIPFVWICLMPGHAERHSIFMPSILWPAMAALLLLLWGRKAFVRD